MRSRKVILSLGLVLSVLFGSSYIHAQDYKALRSPDLKKLPDSLKNKSLVELSIIFNTDKQPSMHNFISVYDRNFTPIKDSVKRILEIGIFNGASHKMWKCFFPNAEVYGIDIKTKPWVEKLGIHTYLADQANREQLQAFIDSSGGQFDIIVDDGGHYMNHQQVSLGFLFKHLKPGGFFIIEDVHTSIPAFYHGFGVDSLESNTTLKMINDFTTTERIKSVYMSRDEEIYLEQYIDYVELVKIRNGMHSTLCVFRKKRAK